MSEPILGCIADDLTGATDLCNNLARAGMRVILTIGVPDCAARFDADAYVVALKSRNSPPEQAVTQSLQACRWLRALGVRQIYFKICSTFDSTSEGNIGPVIEALMEELGVDLSVVVPAFPDNDRTVYRGHLFVGDALLSESSMRNHPLTPMTDANLVRFLDLQLRRSKRKVGLIASEQVSDSAASIRRRIGDLRAQGVSVAIADTLNNDDLARLASALHDTAFVTAGSGLGMMLPAGWGFQESEDSGRLPAAMGRKAVVSGSCSAATNAQVGDFLQRGGLAYALNPERLADNLDAEIAQVLGWADSCWKQNEWRTLLVYSTAQPESVKATHAVLGYAQSSELVERALAAVAHGLVARGVGQLLVAGGETAGACVRALGTAQMQIGPQIDPGVPWCYGHSLASPLRYLHLTLKSGNFGTVDFFTKAFKRLM